MNSLVQCPSCRAWLVEGIFNHPDWLPCPACGVALQVEVFPALFRKQNSGPNAETLIIEGESSCFNHPQKKAVRPCDGCGRFLCSLCDCELNGQHFCPSCLESGKAKGRIKSLDQQRTLYDSIALSFAVYPILMFYFTIITAPMTLYVAIRYWKAPPSLVRRSKARFVAAIVIALLQLTGWGIFFVTLSVGNHH